MSCRRAFDVDLAAFLHDPRAPELADFVEHYPRCPECAAEVRAWTEVHLALAARHPAPAELLAYGDGALPADARATVEAHLARCPSCAEELRALRRFDGVARQGAGRLEPAGTGTRAGGAAPGARRGTLRRVLWHPAFAYAVALLLLVPTVMDLARRPESPAGLHHAAPDGGAVPPDREASSRPAPAPSPAARPAEPSLRPQATVAPPSAQRPAAGPQAGKLDRPGAERLEPSEEPAATARDADAPAMRERAGAPPTYAPSFDARTQILTLPVPEAARHAATAEVRLRDVTGARELRQRVDLPRAGEPLTIRLPADWLSPGAWEVELHAAGSVTRFPLRVP